MPFFRPETEEIALQSRFLRYTLGRALQKSRLGGKLKLDRKMGLTPAMVAAIVALLVSLSATYNAYVLRGGRLAWSQVLTALATVCLMLSIVLPLTGISLPTRSAEILSILGFLLLFAGSLKLRNSLK